MLRKISLILIMFFCGRHALSQDTLYKDFWDNGRIKNLRLSNNNSTSIRFYYENGKLRFSGNELADKKYGKWIYFRLNGDTLKVDNYKNGLLDSISIHYGKNRKIEEIRTYKNDTLNGFSFSFYPSGQIMIINYNLKGESVFSETYFEKINKINAIKNQLPSNVFFMKNLYPNGSIKRIIFEYNSSNMTLLFNELGILRNRSFFIKNN